MQGLSDLYFHAEHGLLACIVLLKKKHKLPVLDAGHLVRTSIVAPQNDPGTEGYCKVVLITTKGLSVIKT